LLLLRSAYVASFYVLIKGWKTKHGNVHGQKSFVMLTKSFVKVEIAKTFCYNNKMFSSINKTFRSSSKILVAATKILFLVRNFVVVPKPFFSV